MFGVWFAHPFYLSISTHHAVVSLPHRRALAVAQWTRPLAAITATFTTVQRHVFVRPGDAARKARAHVDTQLLDGQDIVVGRRRRVERAAGHQVGKRGRHAQAASATTWRGRKVERNGGKCVKFLIKTFAKFEIFLFYVSIWSVDAAVFFKVYLATWFSTAKIKSNK